MLTRLLTAAISAVGLLALGIVVVTSAVREVPEHSPLVFLVDAELRQLSKLSSATDIVFDTSPQDGTRASMDRLSMKPTDMARTLATVNSHLLTEGAYRAGEPGTDKCPITSFPEGCTATFVKPGSEIQIERQSSVLVISKFTLR